MARLFYENFVDYLYSQHIIYNLLNLRQTLTLEAIYQYYEIIMLIFTAFISV